MDMSMKKRKPPLMRKSIVRYNFNLLTREITPYYIEVPADPRPINPETDTPYSRAELTRAFDLVENKTHWTYPIDCLIRAEDRDRVNEAIIFFTGSIPEFIPFGKKRLRVRAAGYGATMEA